VPTYYLIDQEYRVDEESLFATMGHLLVFNPGQRDLELEATVYFEGAEPKTFALPAPAGQSTESNYANWPVEPNTLFALAVESPEPVACQCTIGWNVTNNDYAPQAATKSPLGVRECAKSYAAIVALSREWYLPDGIVIDNPDGCYVRESEWAVVLNPGRQDARVTMVLHYANGIREHEVKVPAQRLRRVPMDDLARRNAHYGVHFRTDQPVAAQWLRAVNWNDRDELMAFWSVPCVPGPLK